MKSELVHEIREVPVLLITFNRPTKTRQMISALRDVRPRQLFVAADGPRPDKPDDAKGCAESRRALDEIDWPCTVHRLFQDTNLGCKRGPETAITWFFSQVPAGIILEDDCVPTADFFPYCAELLERFSDNERVMMISGWNALGTWSGTTASYVFSRTAPAWGWATWRRAWQHYDPDMTAWTSSEAQHAVRSRMPAAEFRMTRRRFDQVHSGELDAWDYAWLFAVLRTGGMSAIPAQNTIRNVGFDKEATHTTNPWSPDARIPTARMTFPLSHPVEIKASKQHEDALFRRRFSRSRRVMSMLPYSVELRIREAVHRVALRASRPNDPTPPLETASRGSEHE